MNKITKKILTEISYNSGHYLVRPEFVSLIFTFACNFRCASCSIWKKTVRNELSEKQWLDIAKELKNVLDKKAFVEINGGEPLLRKPLVLALIKELKNYFNSVTLNSNGLLLEEKTIQELAAAKLDAVKISFYSLTEEIHNFLRGHPQAYQRALQAIALLNKSAIKTEVGILITAKNIRGLPELISYLQNLKNVSLILQPLDESVESAESKDKKNNRLLTELWPSAKEVHDFFNWLDSHRHQIKNSASNINAIRQYYLEPASVLQYRCFAGQRSLVIYPNGKIALCFKGAIIGQVPSAGLPAILKSQTTARERKNIRNCQKYCRIIGCNFSRGVKEFIFRKK